MTARKTRRRKKSAAARFRPFWIPIAFLALAAAYGGYYAATWPGFDVHGVTVTGNRIVSSRQVVAASGIAAHENLWLQNMAAAAERVRAIPYVGSVTIRRTLPASVQIAVRERVPFAQVQSGRRAVLVDRDLRVLQDAPGSPALPIFMLRAAEPLTVGRFLKESAAVRLRDDEEALARAHVAARRLQFDRYGDLDVTTPGGVRLLLGDDRTLQRKIVLVSPILSQVAAGGRKIAAVDLRAPKAPVVLFRPER